MNRRVVRVGEHATDAEVMDAIAAQSPKVRLPAAVMAIPGGPEMVADYLGRFGPRVQRANPDREARAAAKREKRRARNLSLTAGRPTAPDAHTTDFDLLGGA